jgi:hypothetical protein
MGSNEPLPFADEWDDAYQFLANNPRKQIQITTGLAKRLDLF